MAMMRFDPFANMLSLRDAMSQLLQDSFVMPSGLTAQSTTIMPVDVYETDDAFVVKAFMPGFTADDLQVSVEQRTVTIQGEPRADTPEGWRPVLKERSFGALTRTFTLPVPVQADKVQAQLVNGVLSLTLPKAESVKPRKIQITG